ncbi:type II toxin-antitoxin system YafO family toxin [Sessilibacter corallicola]|uniref:Toxin YafO n=1 Tax=Sessilibacter corallicola TaxID=2904075 RepID=A0ABQ0A7J0_9GAMM
MKKEVRVFSYKPFKDSISHAVYESIKNKFLKYKETGIPPSDFGRDTTFDFPQAVKDSGLQHIHIKDKTSKRWNLHKFSFNKTSNTALLYSSNYFNPDAYLLIGLIEDAHERYNDVFYLLEMAEIAERFNQKKF